VKAKDRTALGPFVSNFTQSVSTRTAEQQTDDEGKPVIDYEKAEASSLQTRHGELDEGWMGKLAGCTDVEGNRRSLHLLHEKTKKEEQDKVRSAKRGADPLSMGRASKRKKRVATTKKEKKKAKKRVEWLTRHICILKAHKTKFPSGYYKAENAKGNVLGSLCIVFSVPAKKVNGTTTNKAADKRLAIQKALGEENPKRVFDETLEDLKQQLVSEVMNAAYVL
jgi:phosphate/sulfate permease